MVGTTSARVGPDLDFIEDFIDALETVFPTLESTCEHK